MPAASFRRARAPERKLERRDAILDVAERCVLRTAFGAICMNDVAGRLGLSKGTLYLYFSTKEALFLGVMRRAFERFFARAGEALGTGRATRAEVADALLTALDSVPALPRLASVLHSSLEHNVSAREIAAFKHFLREHVVELGERIDRSLGWRAGSGARLLLRFHVLVIGLHDVSTPSPAVARALADEELALFRIDFRSEFAAMLRLLLQPNLEEN